MYHRSVIFILSLFIAGCKIHSTYSDKFGKIENVSVIALELNSRNEDTVYRDKLQPITDAQTLQRMINEINEARIDGPWKGMGWDELKITTKDSVVILKTNGKVFGYNNSGTFYKFTSKNILKEYWKIEKK